MFVIIEIAAKIMLLL